MGRSVDYLNHALHVTYIHVESSNDEDDASYDADWDYFTETVMENIPNGIKSLNNTWRDGKWDGNETRIIFENKHCEIGLSEYCGIASVSIRDKENTDYPGLAQAWIDKVWPRIVNNLHEVFGDRMLIKQGSFSNGEGVYKRMKS